MNYAKSVQFLLDHAYPSIVYRTRKEILGESRNTQTMLMSLTTGSWNMNFVIAVMCS